MQLVHAKSVDSVEDFDHVCIFRVHLLMDKK
jgi:hypothetical protein